MKVGLINSNRRGMREEGMPPVPPLGLEYLVDDLLADHHEVELLDLCFVDEADQDDALQDYASDKDVIGITFRNFGVDNLWMEESNYLVPKLQTIVEAVKRASRAPVVLGGQGFSIYPEETLERVGADFGIAGPGEIAFRDLLRNLADSSPGTILTGPANTSVVHQRNLIDYDQYLARESCYAIQTKSGCPFKCSFCVEASKPSGLRSIESVGAEVELVLARGTKFIFFADAEFNTHIRRSIELCQHFIDRGFEFDWTTFLNPIPMTDELARIMKKAGCVEPCVSMSAGNDDALGVLETYTSADKLRRMAEYFHACGLSYTVDVMFGTPGETLADAKTTVALLREIKPTISNLNLGIRLYRTTGMGRRLLAGKYPTEGTLYGHTEDNDNLYKPIFYISDMAILDYLKEVTEEEPSFKLLGHGGFEGLNYLLALHQAS